MLNLYPYQINILNKIESEMSQPGNIIIVMPTGSGKSLIIAEIAKWTRQPVLVLQPSKEILIQNKVRLSLLVPKDEIGIYSASLNQKTIKTYTLATIGSIYKKPQDFSHFKLVIIDECNMVNHKKLNTMFMSFLKKIGSPKVVGLTATPYRQETWGERLPNGYVLSHTTTKMINRCMNPFWSRISISLNIQDLIEAGYLMPLTYKNMSIIAREDIPVNVSRTDYDMTLFKRAIVNKQNLILNSLNYAQSVCKHVLVFCATVSQAEELHALTPNSGLVTAKTGAKQRDQLISDFKAGKIHTVFNVDCLTVGFDFPELDGIVVLRPTQSIRTHVQMLGRGVRISPGKKYCMVFDLVGNVAKLGEVETIKVERLEGGWDIVSSKGTWHGKELYTYVIKI